MNTHSPYYYISKYRSELMGFAILWVVWFHSSFYLWFIPIEIVKTSLNLVKYIGYGGVDVFFLVSGIGIYHSLQKHNISTYFKNRLKKILPVWWAYLLLLLVLTPFLFHEVYSKSEILGFASFTGFWLNMEHQGNWYVYAIILVYMVSPIFFSLINDSRNKKKTLILMMICAIIISFSFFKNPKLALFSRFPVYLIGMYFAATEKQETMSKTKWIYCIFFFIIGLISMFVCVTYFVNYLWYGLWWYPFILVAPTMSLIIAKLFDIFQKMTTPLRFVLRLCGQSSLEILLISDFLFDVARKTDLYFIPKRLVNFSIMISGILLGYLFHILIERGKKCCGQLYEKWHTKHQGAL